MRVDAAELTRLASMSGFPATTLERVLRLRALAQDIAIHPTLGRVLALKGGTALNLFFGPPARLSVDLDYNYIGSADRETMEAERPALESALAAIGRGQQYHVQWSRVTHAGRKAFFHQGGNNQRTARVEVDLNYLHRQPLLPLIRRQMWHPDGRSSRDILLMSSEEICAGKICAFLERGLPRDLFDVAHLPRSVPSALASQSFRTVFVALAGALPRSLDSYQGEGPRRLSDQDLSQQLQPMLARGTRSSVRELKQAAADVLKPLLDLTPTELEFSRRLQVGELCPELLAPEDPGLADRIRRHPVLLWKVKNARDYAARQGRRRQ